MNKRPISITIIAWFLIASTSFLLIYSLANFNDPASRSLMRQSFLPLSIQFALLYLGLAISLFSGIAFLKGLNWARYLYVGWCVIGFIIGFATSTMKIVSLPGLVLFLVEVFFLFRPKANSYFLSKQIPADKETEIVEALPRQKLWISAIKIIFYIMAVTFIGTGNMMAFLNDAEAIAMVFIFIVLGLLLLLSGLAVNRFQNWKRDSGIVLISGALYAAFVAMTVNLVSLLPEFRKELEIPADMFIFNDYLSGVSFVVLFAVVGFLMLKFNTSDSPDNGPVRSGRNRL